MAAKLRFLGVAAYEIINSRSQRILIDPFIDSSPGCPIKSTEFDKVDLICVTHAAIDHYGDTAAIALRTGAPVVCGAEIKADLLQRGIPEKQIQATTWNIRVRVNGIVVHPVECHHWSTLYLPNGQFASGVPNAFIVHVDEGIRFYHYGDTALFSDLKLIGDLYRPTHGAIGIAQPVELFPMFTMAGEILTGEMDPREGLLAAQWLGLDTVLPCHYYNAACEDVQTFQKMYAEAQSRGEFVPPNCQVMKPGEWLDLKPVLP